MRWVIVLNVLGACAGSSDVLPDGDPLGPPLRVRWNAVPATIPGTATSEITIDSAEFALDDLRVVGDAGPGDPRTFRDHVSLAWSTGMEPADEEFPDAPPGLYSRLVFDLDPVDNVARVPADTEASFQITGMVRIGGTPVPYRILDTAATAISFENKVELPAGGAVTMAVRVDLAKIVAAVDYQVLPVVDGERLLGTTDVQMPELRKKVIEAFTKGDSSP